MKLSSSVSKQSMKDHGKVLSPVIYCQVKLVIRLLYFILQVEESGEEFLHSDQQHVQYERRPAKSSVK